MASTGTSVNEEEDPLIKALPPATDYLTYLTVLEYQLTPARLPTLHKVLQDEKLTTNIGWDLVQLLLPLLPASQECLQDVARLGNPREVILRAADALMKLQPVDGDDDDDDDQSSEAEEENRRSGNISTDLDQETTQKQLPLHILQFNSLLSMLTTLHSRIRTKSPSRFVAASLQAALEAYTSYPSAETTISFLNFLRSISPNKRPELPPRGSSDHKLASSSASGGISAPDPEEEAHLESSRPEEQPLIQKLLQFGLIEAVKTYVLYCTDRKPEGMQWAPRLQEKLAPASTPLPLSTIQEFGSHWFLTERDRTIGKILALSRDFGLKSQDLLHVVFKRGEEQPPLDFEELPESEAQIPLEPHGCLLLLAARYASSLLFNYSEQEEPTIAMYPDLSTICSNFLDQHDSPYDAAIEEPTALIDSLLSLALIAFSQSPSTTTEEDELSQKQLIINLTACARAPSVCSISRLEKIPLQSFQAISNANTRFNVIEFILKDENLRYAHEPAIRWLKEELVSASNNTLAESTAGEPFTNATSFATLFAHIYAPLPAVFQTPPAEPGSTYLHAFLKFIQTYAPLYLAALNLYLFLLKSHVLREKLELDQTFNVRFRDSYLMPLKKFIGVICEDEEAAGAVKQEMGGAEEVVEMGRSVAGVVGHVIGEIEEAMDRTSDDT